jgi:hypothetical protein
MGSLSLLAQPYKWMERLRRTLHAPSRTRPLRILTELRFSRDGAGNSLILAVTNRSKTEVWAEEVHVVLAGLEADLQTCAASDHAVVKILQSIAPGEMLNVPLSDALYDSAGRPQSAYSFDLSTILCYRADREQAELLEQSLPFYRAVMVALAAVSLRQMRWFDRPASSQKAERPDQSQTGLHQVRRSMRVPTRVPVAVHGTAPDGSRFVDFTRALDINAHGCLIQLPIPVSPGDRIVLRNIGNRKEQVCRVVYLREIHGQTSVGLAFIAAAPGFWGLDPLPANWEQFLR